MEESGGVLGRSSLGSSSLAPSGGPPPVWSAFWAQLEASGAPIPSQALSDDEDDAEELSFGAVSVELAEAFQSGLQQVWRPKREGGGGVPLPPVSERVALSARAYLAGEDFARAVVPRPLPKARAKGAKAPPGPPPVAAYVAPTPPPPPLAATEQGARGHEGQGERFDLRGERGVIRGVGSVAPGSAGFNARRSGSPSAR